LTPHKAKVARATGIVCLVSFRFYTTKMVSMAEETAKRGVPIRAITDCTLSPCAKLAQVLFALPEHDYTASRSVAAHICLAQPLCVALATRMQNDGAVPRIPVFTAP
jgi:DNA-binding MurR/RpiR family transcriptional regulator